MYQTDRLTLGRNLSRFGDAQPQVIEKVVYKEDEQSQALVVDLRARLEEALLRIVLLSIEAKSLKQRAQKVSSQTQGFKVFENSMMYENQTLKGEVERLSQMMRDKEKEIQFVRDSEIRKSAIQTGEMTIRLGVLTKENQRLQNSQIEKINQLNNLGGQIHKLQQEKRPDIDQSFYQKQIAELKQTVSLKEREIYELKVNHSKEITSKEGTITSLLSKLDKFEHDLKRADEINFRSQSDSLEISRLKNAVGTLQIEIDNKTEKVLKLEQQHRAVVYVLEG
jgi:hypothetical protein